MVYDVDRVNESVEEENDILDNMLEACDYMMNMLGLDEGAYRRYMNAQAKKQEEDKAKAQAYEDLGDNLDGKARDAAYEKADRHAENARNRYENNKRYMVDGPSDSIRRNLERADEAGKDVREGYRAFEDEYKEARKAKKNWMNDHGNSGRDPRDKKPNAYLDAQNKKRGIKEACLAILSVIDDID